MFWQGFACGFASFFVASGVVCVGFVWWLARVCDATDDYREEWPE